MGLRVIPCDSEKCRRRRGPGVATLPDGKPYTMGRAPGREGLKAKCARCKRVTIVDALRFNRLPELSLDQAKEMGVAALLTDDLVGAGMTIEQVEQVAAAGVDLLHPLLHPSADERGPRE